MSQNTKLRVAICGGGIAGMALAAFLARADNIETHLFEAQAEARMTGVGIAVWRRYWELLREEIDLEKAFVALGNPVPDWTKIHGPRVRKADAPSAGVEFCALSHGPFIIPRTTMSAILLARIRQNTSCHLNFGKRLVRYKEAGDEAEDRDGHPAVTLHFADGSSDSFDILVGADGVFSRVRNAMFQDRPGLASHVFSGQLAYRMSCLAEDVPAGNLAHEGFLIWSGKGRHVTSNAMGNTIQMTAWENVEKDSVRLDDTKVSQVDSATVTSHYDAWEPDLVSLLGAIKTPASCWPIHVTEKLPTFVSRRVALIGDAAHGMTPHQGLGAGQGIEDAFILSKILSSPYASRRPVADLLSVYDEIRRPESQRVADQSLANGLNFAFIKSGNESCSLEEIGSELNDGCDWLIDIYGCQRELRRTNEMLVQRFGN